MKDGSFVTGLFLIAIVVMIVYPVYNLFLTNKQLEQRILDQQALIEEQDQMILKLNNTNVLLQSYLLQQEQKKRESIFY